MRLSTKSVAASFVVLTLAGTLQAQEQPTPEQVSFFEAKIRPVLVKECYGCHSSEAGNVRGGLRLDNKELMRLGGSSGPAVVPGDLEASLLFNAIRHEGFQMPPKRQLATGVIEDFRQWIEMGAPDPREAGVTEIKSTISEEDILEAKQSFWAYQPPRRQSAPVVRDSAWPVNDIDSFILARLEASDLRPAMDADAHQVVRRLCFDLTGLPPTVEQVQAFEADWKRSPQQAVEGVVDELLEQEQYGERWGRHWLDVARYGESTGREVNMTFPHAWRYRDYVIDSFNQDKPFKQFVQEQIAGDLLPAKSDQQWTQNLIATTFLAIGPKNVNEQNRIQFDADLIDEQIDATTRVFLGMSVACARCHDHKFDAIPQTDYYALAGIFGNAATYFGNPPSEYGSFTTAQARRSSSLLLLPIDDPNPYDRRYDLQQLAELRQELSAKMREAAEGRRSLAAGGSATAQNAIRNRLRLSNEMAQLSAKLAVVDDEGNPHSYCMGVQDRQSNPRNARLLVRGEIDQPAQEVQRGFPQVLCSSSESIDPDSSGRLEFARWIGSDQNPLTARVMANRVWQQLLGQGIVTSTENFGVTGQAPSHPELLDYLSVRLMESDWSVKSLIREICTSRVYRISSRFDESSHQYDPDNALLWRANPRRLDAESIRDGMLSISGEIDLDRPRGSEVAKAGYQRVVAGSLGDPRESARRAMVTASTAGRSTAGRGPTSRGAYEAAMREAARKMNSQLDMEDAKYRSVYLPIVRDQEPRSLDVFDFADSSTVTGTRESSNTSNQALFMLNNPLVMQQSEAFANRLRDSESKATEQIRLAFMLAYGRNPTSQERAAAIRFLNQFDDTTRTGNRGSDALAVFCQSLFASAEFRYLD